MRKYPRALCEIPSSDEDERHFAVSLSCIAYFTVVTVCSERKFGSGYRIFGVTKRRFRRGVKTSKVADKELMECPDWSSRRRAQR